MLLGESADRDHVDIGAYDATPCDTRPGDRRACDTRPGAWCRDML